MIDRESAMIKLYREGRTYQFIGETFSITRERVRQILNKYVPNEIEKRKEYMANKKLEYQKKMVEKLLAREAKINRGCIKCGKKITRFCREMCSKCYLHWAYHNMPGRKERTKKFNYAYKKSHPDVIKAIQKKALRKYYLTHKEKVNNYSKNYFYTKIKTDPVRYARYLEGHNIRHKISYYKNNPEKLAYYKNKLQEWKDKRSTNVAKI